MYSSKYAPKPAETPPAAPAVSPPAPQPSSAPATEVKPAPILDPAPPVASSIEPTYDMDPSIDEFAQTRPPDDLFDDDFTPVVESQLVYDPPPPAPASAPAPVSAPAPQPEPTFREPRYNNASRGDLPRGVPRGPRGRGRGGGRGGNITAATVAPKSPPKPAAESTTAEPSPDATEDASEEVKSTEDAPSTSPPPTAPTGPAAGKPTPSVRGDRSLTGGPAKKKLTEDELNAKLAAMSLKNKALTEAHEKAQADQDAFAEREKVAAAKRKVERIERQALMGEREKNRQRKLQVMGGREWDAEKNEDDFKDDGRRARRGAHGGITGSRHVAPAKVEGDGEVPDGGEGGQRGGYDGSRGRGRGRGGRGRGRGDNHQSTPHKKDAPQSVPTSADFPDLPASAPPPKTESGAPKDLEFPNKKKPSAAEPAKLDTTAKSNATATPDEKKGDPKPRLDKQTSFGFSPATEKRSWADQMDATSP